MLLLLEMLLCRRFLNKYLVNYKENVYFNLIATFHSKHSTIAISSNNINYLNKVQLKKLLLKVDIE